MRPVNFEYVPPGRLAERIDLLGYRDDDVIAQHLRSRHEFFEIDLLEHVLLAGPVGGVYLDVGANIGNHAVFFARYCADHVVAVEPHPRLLPVLRRNLEHNCPGRFTIQPVALADRIATGRMTLRTGFEHNIGGSQVEVGTDAAGGVTITTLDTLLDGFSVGAGPRLALLKVDVEGMELDVFRGGKRLLEHHRPQIVVELATEAARAATRAHLTRAGYQDSGRRFGWTPTYHFIDPSVHQLRPYAVHPRIDPEVETLKTVTEEILALVPAGQTYIFVDQEQWWAGLAADGRTRMPFTERDGLYWGPPASDAAALQELGRLTAAGARFIIFAAPAFWWLDFYRQLTGHLQSRHRLIVRNQRLVAYELLR